MGGQRAAGTQTVAEKAANRTALWSDPRGSQANTPTTRSARPSRNSGCRIARVLVAPEVRFSTAGRQDVNLHIEGLAPGLHSFLVHLDVPGGERLSYRVQHFVAAGES